MADGDLYYSLESNYDPADDFLPYDDQTRLQSAGSNDSTDDIQSTAAAEVIGVALYPVVTWFAVLLTLTSVGLVGNIIVLVATTVFDEHTGCRGRLNRASKSVVVNLGVALVASCVVVGPLEFAVVAENYVKRSVSAFVCRAASAAYHLFAGTIVSCLVLYALVRRCRLQRAADGRRSTTSKGLRSAGDAGTCLVSCRRQIAALRGSSAAAGAVDVLPNCGRKRTIARTVLPWLVGVVCSLLASVDYGSLVQFEVCRQSVFYRKHVKHGDAYKPSLGWTGALVISYWVVLMLAGAWLIVVYFWNRRLFACTLTQHDPTMTRDRSVLSRDEGRRRTSCISATGASSSDNAAADEDGEASRHEPSNSLRKKRMARRQSGERASKSSQDRREIEEDDDTFDMKMRMKFQKKSRSSGRRHTVANIGLPSLSGRLRRGSLSDTGLTAVAGISPSGSGSGATTPEYHYVRKWSVDITALANQLENPKAAVAGRSGSYQFAELQGALRTSPCNASRRSGSPVAARPTLPCIIAEVETTDQETAERDVASEEDTTSKHSNRNHQDSKAHVTENGNTDTSSPTKRCSNEAGANKKNNSDHDEEEKQKTDSVYADVEQAESPVEEASVEGSDFSWPVATAGSGAGAKSKHREQLRQLHNAVEHVSSLPLDPPSIIVSGLNVDDGHEACSTNTDEEDDFGGKDQIWTTSEAAANQDVAVSEEQSSTVTYDGSAPPDDGQLRRVRRELQRAVRTFVMLMVCAALVLPYVCVSVWNGVTVVRYVSYNLSLAATAVMALTAAVMPPILVWSDKHLCARVLRMWALATRLRCVCHCHIGHGKNCFQRPRTSRRRDL